ncbi:MAG: beta-glucosidase [Chloroflexi bacterium HGW-Chloroflexi-6]|nr:MAG: beta-glucosidase [Chloroflexi bacterium HGW-Chloroflexi-6]
MKNKFPILSLTLILLISACQPAAVDVNPAPIATTQTTEEMPAEANVAPLYTDSSLSAEERASDLLARMSLDEKIGQMTQVEKNSILPGEVSRYYIGSILSGGGGAPTGDDSLEGWVKMVDGLQAAALETPLAIPLIYGVDAVHGHNNVKGATIFPHNIGLGATNDPELVEKIGRATAEEMLATGISWDFAPVLAVVQDIRWGRTYESYGENTELVTRLGVAYQNGLQAAGDGDSIFVLATPKHYIGDGGTTWASSTTDNYKLDQGDTQMDEARLRELFLPPYQAAVEAGAQSVMVSYSSWNGVKMHGHKYLITDVLKGELGFEGFVVSDWAGIDQVDSDYYTAVVTAINAGVDMNMVPQGYPRYLTVMQQAVEKGDIPMERIDDAVLRILTVKFKLGLFEKPFADPAYLETVGSQAHRDLAREAVAKSLVLLKNDNATLPLAKDAGLIFVAGASANDIGAQCGGWTIEWQGKSGNITTGTTILEAIEASASAEVRFDRFGKFESEQKADVAVVVIGERPYAEGRGDKENPSLSKSDIELIQRVREQSQRVVVILLSGRPLVITEALPYADAFVAAWLPGTEGSGVADVLFGDKPFTGKTPFSWPRSADQLPFDFANLPADGCAAPLFPYGYGLDVTSSEPVSLPVCP